LNTNVNTKTVTFNSKGSLLSRDTPGMSFSVSNKISLSTSPSSSINGPSKSLLSWYTRVVMVPLLSSKLHANYELILTIFTWILNLYISVSIACYRVSKTIVIKTVNLYSKILPKSSLANWTFGLPSHTRATNAKNLTSITISHRPNFTVVMTQ